MRIIAIVSLFSSLFLLSKGWYRITDGYKTAKIIPSAGIFYRWEEKAKSEPDEQIQKILDQPFYYLGRGQQCYAFSSSDDKYVLKIVRLHKYRIPFWCALFPQKGLIDHRKKSWDRTISSFAIAFDHLKEESALIYLHDKPTKSLPLLSLYDRIGRKNVVDSNHLVFVLQKKAVPILSALSNWDNKEVRSFLDKYLKTVKIRLEKNIRNKNRNVMKNLGVLDDRIIEFDVGEFRFHPTAKNSQSKKIEMEKSTKRLKKWLSLHHPDLIPYLDDQIDRHCL